MNFQDWYTDRMDLYRVQAVRDGALTRHERVLLLGGVPCRLYQASGSALDMGQTAASVRQKDWVQCGNEVDVQAGDELHIRRGAGLGRTTAALRAFAAEPNHFFEPFGAVLPGLAHQEIPLVQEEWLKGGIQDDASGAGGGIETGTGTIA